MRDDNKAAGSAPQTTRRLRARAGRDPPARRLGLPHRPAALAARIKPSSETVTASARHLPGPTARQFTRDTLGALGNPDGQQPDITGP